MQVLVVGGAGYIGSHVCKEIAKKGWTPVVYDNLSTGHEWAVKWGVLEIGDLADAARLKTVFKKYKPEAVIHLAAFAYVGESVVHPEKYYVNNVCGTLSLLSAMREMNVRKFVFSSTCASYGLPDKIPIDESQEQKPINPYGTSKLFVEKILADYVAAYKFKAICLRYFNAAGSDPEGEIGEVHDPETHIIPIAIEVAKGTRKQVTVFGNDYDTADGSCIRDYTHVADLARAHVASLNYMENEEFTFDAFNLGTGRGYSVFDIIKAVEKVSLKKVHFTVSERRAGDPPVLVADPSKIRKAMGWQAEYTEIDEIVRHAWNFAVK